MRRSGTASNIGVCCCEQQPSVAVSANLAHSGFLLKLANFNEHH